VPHHWHGAIAEAAFVKRICERNGEGLPSSPLQHPLPPPLHSTQGKTASGADARSAQCSCSIGEMRRSTLPGLSLPESCFESTCSSPSLLCTGDIAWRRLTGLSKRQSGCDLGDLPCLELLQPARPPSLPHAAPPGALLPSRRFWNACSASKPQTKAHRVLPGR
jgi:hypothetical protein